MRQAFISIHEWIQSTSWKNRNQGNLGGNHLSNWIRRRCGVKLRWRQFDCRLARDGRITWTLHTQLQRLHVQTLFARHINGFNTSPRLSPNLQHSPAVYSNESFNKSCSSVYERRKGTSLPLCICVDLALQLQIFPQTGASLFTLAGEGRFPGVFKPLKEALSLGPSPQLTGAVPWRRRTGLPARR